MPLLLAAAAAGAMATLAWWAATLRPSGAAAAAVVGVLVLSTTGWAGGVVLLAFFLPASASSRLWPPPPSSLDAKDDRRDAWQVLANGGAPAFALLVGGPGALLGYAAGLAAAAADTWATSIGAHSKTPPRHILTWMTVPPGTSGGVTPLGTVGAAAGALLVALAASPLVGWQGATVAVGLGLAGMCLDSALGAAVQGRFHCDRCDRPSERRRHRCGASTRHLGGFRWLSNDAVNALATAAATAAGWAIWAWWCPT